MVRAAPAAEIEEDGLLAVVGVLGRRKDARLLLALVDSDLFLPWYGSASVASRVYILLFDALFDPYGPKYPPSDDEVSRILERFRSRGGVMTVAMVKHFTRKYTAQGKPLSPTLSSIVHPNDIAELPVGIDVPITTWRQWIDDNRVTRSFDDVFSTVLPHLRGRHVLPSIISALLGNDIWIPRDIDNVANALGARPDIGTVSRAADNALEKSGTRAAMDVFNYARERGLFLAHRTSQHIITALVAFRNFSMPHPNDISSAVDVFWRYTQPDNPDKDPTPVNHVPLLNALSRAIGVPRRWDTIRDIISFLRETEQPVAPHLPKEQSTLLEETFLCHSHTAAIQMLSERWNLLQDDLQPWLHHICQFRYDDAPTCSLSDFIAFSTSCGHGVTPQLLIEWIGSVSHSRALLYTSWERRALGPSRDYYDELSFSYLRQAEDAILADQHRLDTVEVRLKLMAAYIVGDTRGENGHHALRCWTWIVDRNAITDAVLAHAITSSSNISLLRRIWADSLRQGVVPSISTYARYAKKLICSHLLDEGFEIFRDRVGDDPAFRYVAVALFARLPPGDVERYARELPKICRDPRTQAEVVQARAHRRSEARQNQLREN